MSINHLIDSATTPRYDIYVKDIDASGNVGVDGGLSASVITARDLLNIAVQDNYNDIMSRFPAFVNPYLLDEGFNDFVNPRDMNVRIQERQVAGGNNTEVYKFSWTGDATAIPGDQAIFDFKSRAGYFEVVSLQATCQDANDVTIHDIGVITDAPQDPANDFEVELDTTNVGGGLSAGREIYFDLEITLRLVA